MACKSKNWGKGVVKPFTIILNDMSGPDGKDHNGPKKVSFAVCTVFLVLTKLSSLLLGKEI